MKKSTRPKPVKSLGYIKGYSSNSPSIALQTFRALFLQNICQIFSQTCISHHRWGKFSDLCCSSYWKMHLPVKKLNLEIFTHAPHRSKIVPKVLIINPRQREITHSPQQYFSKMYFPFPQQKRWRVNYVTASQKGKENFQLF